jgi:hypothetical protein
MLLMRAKLRSLENPERNPSVGHCRLWAPGKNPSVGHRSGSCHPDPARQRRAAARAALPPAIAGNLQMRQAEQSRQPARNQVVAAAKPQLEVHEMRQTGPQSCELQGLCSHEHEPQPADGRQPAGPQIPGDGNAALHREVPHEGTSLQEQPAVPRKRLRIQAPLHAVNGGDQLLLLLLCTNIHRFPSRAEQKQLEIINMCLVIALIMGGRQTPLAACRAV